MSNNENNSFAPEELDAAQLTAYALGQLQGEERGEIKRKLTASKDGVLQREISEIEGLVAVASVARASEALPRGTPALRERLKKALDAESQSVGVANRTSVRAVVWLCAGAAACLALISLMLPSVQSSREASRRAWAANEQRIAEWDATQAQTASAPMWDVDNDGDGLAAGGWVDGGQRMMARNPKLSPGYAGPPPGPGMSGEINQRSQQSATLSPNFSQVTESNGFEYVRGHGMGGMMPGGEMGGYGGGLPAARAKTQSQLSGQMPAAGAAQGNRSIDAGLNYPGKFQWSVNEADQTWEELTARRQKYPALDLGKEHQGTEQYEPIIENAFLSPLQQPLSTFSIDVDTASYANMRRFLTSGRLPPRNSVRIEELVNYFRYEYPAPNSRTAGGTPAPQSEPFSVNMELAECPWRAGHLLLRVGLKGKEVHRSERPASNLVFLLDVSGSMSDENKLPLLKAAMKMLAGELGENDRVSIVTYAGEAGLKLKSTRGNQQQRITQAIDSLSAGGSTNGSAGIELAYEQAAANFVKGGTNRVILCTDGDLNVGVTSDEALTRLIKQKATSGVFLTVLGFGEGNLKDAKMEKLADNGNGLYAYIDSVREARKVLVEQLTGSTITIAKDVKIQIEFNPAQIAAYRLLGYENRVLAAEDFNNDKKDAGEIGAGHTVTALYELVPAGTADEVVQPRPGTDPLKYQGTGNGGVAAGAVGGFSGGEGVGGGFGGAVGNALSGVPRSGVQESDKLTAAAKSGELLTLKLRYKEPDGEASRLLEVPLKDRGGSFHSASPDLQFAAAVAGFGMILRNSQHRGNATLEGVAEIASASLGKDEGGYRAEFVDLVRKAQALGAR